MSDGPRDVRNGDRWLEWHFTPGFEERMARLHGAGKIPIIPVIIPIPDHGPEDLSLET